MLYFSDFLEIEIAKSGNYFGKEIQKKNLISSLRYITGNFPPSKIRQGELLIFDFTQNLDIFLKTSEEEIRKCSGCIFFFNEGIEKEQIESLLKNWVKTQTFGVYVFWKKKQMNQIVDDFYKMEYFYRNKKNSTEEITKDILFGKQNSDTLDQIYLLKLTGFPVFQNYRTVLIYTEEEQRQQEIVYEKIRHWFLEQEEDILYTIFGEFLLLILPEKIKNKNVFEYIKDINQLIYKQYHSSCKIALGNLYHGLEFMKESLKEALRTFDMIDLVCKKEKICSYEELGVYQVLYELKNFEICKKYYDQMFCPIWEYDQKNGTNLFKTLETYVEQEFDHMATAEKLYIHRNTLRNRLLKIEKILKKDLNHVNDITEVVTAFKVRRLTNILNKENQNLYCTD